VPAKFNSQRSAIYPATPSVHRCLNIGHRGASADAPENTLVAFELALRQGADGIELDVHLSSDGMPVVIHDARLNRTTSGSGRVSELPFSVLRRLDAGSWFNQRYPGRARLRYAGLKIPSLAGALAWVRRRNCLAFIEIKQTWNEYPGIEQKTLEEIHRAGVAPLATVISFNWPSLARIRKMDSRIALGFDFSRPLSAVRRACAIGATSLLPHWALASRRFIRRAHQEGFRVLAWDLHQPLLMRRKIFDGVDGIITSHPARLAELLRRNPQIAQISQI
jgi:glycerophosphoryl diester phosphodiesterase